MRKRLVVTLVGLFVIAYGLLIGTLVTGTRPALGLDLQGGISVTQEPKAGTTYSDASLDLAVEKIRERVDSLGVAEPEILRQGNTIVVNLPGVKNQQQAVDLVQVTGQVYLRPVLAECQTIDLSALETGTTAASDTTGVGAETTGPATETTVAEPQTTVATETTAGAGPARPVSADNVAAATETTAGIMPISATETTAPMVVSPAPETTTAAPETTTADTGSIPDTTVVVGPTSSVPLDENGLPITVSDPTTAQFLPTFGANPPQYCYVGPAQGSGEVFQDNATATVINGGWGVVVDLRDGAAGNDIWNSLASQCYYNDTTCPTGQLSIELDGSLQSVASVNEPSFNGSVQISGAFTQDEAQQLARVINSGSLPVALQLQSVQNVSPSLGRDSLKAAWVSGLVGVLLVLVFMAFYYRTLGLIVALGLTVSGSLLWSVVSLLSRTNGLALSLSGIAGIIVSVGVTVDSYVVFFERLKDEVRSGRSLRNSAQRGFQGAWRTIVIADLVSLIGALVLWYLTVGAVRGFAFFLGLSTACDLLVSYFFTRPMVLLLARTKWMEKRKVMGIEVSSAPAGGAA
ncbi:MAG: protein translocase subunit SecD [Ilumatobacteraceae bacterium]|jgi:preprotein translocase subunit SecD